VELQAQDHQLRRDTFYLPFFQKLNAEIDRLAAQFGHASLLMMSCDNRLPDRTICVSGDVSDSDFSQPIQTAREMEIDYKVELKTESPFVEGRAASDQVNTFTLKISPASLLDGSDWSDEKSNQVREVLAALVGTLATDPK